MTRRLQKAKKLFQGSFVYIEMYQSGVNLCLFLDKYRFKVVKLKDCKVKYIGTKTFQGRRHYRNRKSFNIANLVNTRVAGIIKYQLHARSNHLLSVKRIKINKEKRASQIKLF